MWSSVHRFYNTNVHNIGLLRVFIGILIIREDGGQLGREMAHLTIAQITIVPNIMRLRVLVKMGTSEYLFVIALFSSICLRR